jgi:hypothetical protein
MSYYNYLVTLTTPDRQLRASSLERSSYGSSYGRSSSYGSSSSSSYSSDGISNRFQRASTVGPCTIDRSNTSYYGVMPFTRQLENIESRMRARRASMAPAVSTYQRAYSSPFQYSMGNDFDAKVNSYANRLDHEETTRNYINSYSSPSLSHSSSHLLRRPGGTFARSYDMSTSPSMTTYSRTGSSDYCSNKELSSYRHYRKSNATLLARNSRAQSPIIGREMDRYYKTERRSDYMGDISSGGAKDFRFYNYRSVPYYGGSDYYAYVPRVVKIWNNEPPKAY